MSLNGLFLEAIFQHRSLTIDELNIVFRNSSGLSIEKLFEGDVTEAAKKAFIEAGIYI